MRFFILLFLCFVLTACDKEPSIAVVDVNYVLTSSPHARQAEAEAAEIQQIYQYNISLIEKKLATYTNKPQAEAWLLEAARKVQAQLTNSRAALSQAMGDTLHKEILVQMGTQYELVLAKTSVLANQPALDITAEVQQGYNAATITWPPRPQRDDNPNLPPDTEAVSTEKDLP